VTTGGHVRAPGLDGATAWLNSGPLTRDDLNGGVVAYDFWTYTCINWFRTLPHIRSWVARYGGHGLTVIGIHTPEFAFEHELANVRAAVDGHRIDYPVALDNDYAIWRAFDNHYWPALYLADADGRIRHHQFGEGGYDDAEEVIEQLLEEAGHDLPRGFARLDAEGVEVAADWDHLDSPETYLGRDRGERLVTVPSDDLRLNQWKVDGDWAIRPDSAFLADGAGTIAYRFRARDVNLVMGSTQGEIPFRVLIDGEAPSSANGADCDAEGNGAVSDPRLYQLIRQRDRIAERTFEITFASPGVGAYSFTFG
jgi:thiol-disulfide isomerase/thioredoxin